MKLLYITTRISGAGGMQRVLSVKTGLLADKGYTVAVLTTNADDEAVLYDFNPAVTFHNITPKRGINYLLSYKKLLNKAVAGIAPDVIIMCDNGPKSFLLPFLLTKKYPLVYERHISKYINEKPSGYLKKLWDKAMYRYMDYCAARFERLVVLTREGASEWNAENVEVIPNPLWFTSGRVSSLEKKKVIAVGRHSYQKGYDRMFRIWKGVLIKHPEWTLEVYGDDNADYDIRQIAKDLEITTGIIFLKPVKDIINAYTNASIYLMTSRYEGFGMVLAEAMACGVPCVAFDCPVGPGEIITNGEDGYLVPDGDSAAFAEKIIQLIENPQLRLDMGAKAKESAKRYDKENIIVKWDALFRSLA